MTRSKTTTVNASNGKALTFLLAPSVLVLLFLGLNYSGNKLSYMGGQFVLSVFFLQTFVLLHECAHLNFFRSRWMNVAFGHLFGILSLLPFYSWQQMHNLHHKWTGWRDKDPTTERTVSLTGSVFKRTVVNALWWLFVPVFYLVYHFSNYWNVFKINRFLNAKSFRKAAIQIALYFLLYLLLFTFRGDMVLHNVLPAFLLSLLWKELVILTQHSHIAIPVADGKQVKPIRYVDQVQYTRSFFLNKWFCKYFLFNFNLHEAHHMKPGVPAYYLTEVDTLAPQKPSFGHWFIQSRKMKAQDFIFNSSKTHGKYLDF